MCTDESIVIVLFPDGMLTNKQRWEKFISALIHHGDSNLAVKDKTDGEGLSRGTDDMEGVRFSPNQSNII